MEPPLLEAADAAPTWRALRASGHFGQYILLCLGILLYGGDSLVAATIMPAAVAEIGGVVYINWTIALYQIGSIITGAAAGSLARRYSLRALFVAGALVYAVGCFIAALAPNMATMLVGRITQGAGGGLMLALSYLAVQLLFPRSLWTKLYALSSAIWTVTSLMGPLIGGLFADAGIWRGAFWAFGVPALGFAAFAGAPLRAPMPSTNDTGPAMSWAALALLTAAVFAVAEAGALSQLRWSLPLGIAGVALLFGSALADRQAQDRIFPHQMLSIRTEVGQGLLMVFALSAGTTAFWAYGPLVLNAAFGIDPLVPGILLAIESLTWSVCTILVASRPAHTESLFIRVGTVVACLGAAGLAIAMPLGSLFGIAVCLSMQGAGFGLSWPFVLRRVVVVAPSADQVIAGSATPAVQRIGYAVGAAATGIAANATGLANGISSEAARAAGMWVFVAFMPLLVLAVYLAFAFTKGMEYGAQSRVS